MAIPIFRSRPAWAVFALAATAAVYFSTSTPPAGPPSLIHDLYYDQKAIDPPIIDHEPYEPHNVTLLKRAPSDDRNRNWLGRFGLQSINTDDSTIDASRRLSAEVKQKLHAVRKGMRHNCDMKRSDERAPTSDNFKPRSGWTTQNILQTYGWTHNPIRSVGDRSASLVEIVTVARDDLGLSNNLADWIKSSVVHNERGSAGYPPTFGNYENYFDLPGGALIAANNWSPEAMIEHYNIPVPLDRIVPFKRYSDVVFVAREDALARFAPALTREGKAVKDLEHVFQYNIIYEPTKKVLQMITGKGSPVGIPRVSTTTSDGMCC